MGHVTWHSFSVLFNMNQVKISSRWKAIPRWKEEKKLSKFLCQTLKIAFFHCNIGRMHTRVCETFLYHQKLFEFFSLWLMKILSVFFLYSDIDIHAHKYWNVAYFQFNWFRLSIYVVVRTRVCVCLCELCTKKVKKNQKRKLFLFRYSSVPFVTFMYFQLRRKDAH